MRHHTVEENQRKKKSEQRVPIPGYELPAGEDPNASHLRMSNQETRPFDIQLGKSTPLSMARITGTTRS